MGTPQANFMCAPQRKFYVYSAGGTWHRFQIYKMKNDNFRSTLGVSNIGFFMICKQFLNLEYYYLYIKL